MSPTPKAKSALAAVRLTSVAFPTLDEIKAALGIPPGDTSQDAAITSTLTATISIVEAYLGRGIKFEADITEQFEPIDTRDPKLFLYRFPVQAVSEVRNEGAAVSGWRLYARQGVVDLGGGCCSRRSHGPCNAEPIIEVDYSGGYPDDAWPPDLADAVMRAFYARWNATQGNAANITGGGAVKQWTADGLTVSLGDTASGMGASSDDVIPPELASVAAILDPYRVRFVRGV